jgi:hypothetical protein
MLISARSLQKSIKIGKKLHSVIYIERKDIDRIEIGVNKVGGRQRERILFLLVMCRRLINYEGK